MLHATSPSRLRGELLVVCCSSVHGGVYCDAMIIVRGGAGFLFYFCWCVLSPLAAVADLLGRGKKAGELRLIHCSAHTYVQAPFTHPCEGGGPRRGKGWW